MSLNYLKDILLEELDRKKRAKYVFEKKINEDFIFTQVKVKSISGKKYLYVYSTKDKKDKYIGPYSPEMEESYLKLVEKRESVNKQLKSILEDIPKIEAMVNII